MKSCLDAAEELLRQAQTWEADANGPAAKFFRGAVENLGDGVNTSEPYVLCNNDGNPALTPTQLVMLDRRGYVVYQDVVFHPGHWRVATEVEQSQGHTDDGKGVFIGHDGAIAAITGFAHNWGRERHLWS